MIATCHNLEDVRRHLGDLGYAGRTRDDVERAIRRAEPLYQAPLERIPVDLDSFDARWRGRTDGLVLGFRSQRGFERWRSKVRGAMKRALGLKHVHEADAGTPDPWQVVREHVAQNQGNYRELTLDVLAGRARLSGRAPHEIDGVWAAAEHARLRYERRKAFRRGLRLFNDLVEARATTGLADHLPATPVAEPATASPRGLCGLGLPPSFSDDLAACRDWYVSKDQDPAFARARGIDPKKERSWRSYEAAVSWLVRELVDGGHHGPDEIVDLASVCRYQPLLDAAIAFSERREAGGAGLSRDSSTLHTRVARISYIAEHWVAVAPAERDQLRRLRRSHGVTTANVGRMSRAREEWLRHLLDARGRALRATLLRAPDTLLGWADSRLARWESLSRRERMRCLRYALAATQTALLLRTMALRSTNLRELTFRGDAATLVLPSGHRSARIEIPGAQVKNGRDLAAPVAGSAWPTVRRWLEVYRPLLVDAHPYGHGAADSAFVFPGTSPTAGMNPSTFAKAFAEGVGDLGLGITPHLCRHAIATLIVNEDRSKVGVVADWLGDKPETVEQVYLFTDRQRAAESGQREIQKLTRRVSRRAA